MPGYEMLSNDEFATLVCQQFGISASSASKDPNIIIETIPVTAKKPRALEYYLNKNVNAPIIVIPTPLEATNLLAALAELPAAYAQYPIIAALDGRGLTEEHIVTAYISPSLYFDTGRQAHIRKVKIYDTKTSDIGLLVDGNQDRTFWQKLKALGRSLLPWPSPQRYTLREGNHELDIIHFSLGLQSLFDGVSCGYHAVCVMKAMYDRESIDKTVQLGDYLLIAINNPVQEVAAAYRQSPDYKNKNKVNATFLAFLAKAWRETWMPGLSQQSTKKPRLVHHLLGWPEQVSGGRLAAYALGGFLLYPLKAAAQLAVEGLPLLLAAMGDYAKNRLIATAPKTVPLQYARSAGLLLAYAVTGFKGLYYLLRPLTSPLVSFEEAYKKHPLLGFLSLGFSIGAYLCLAFFAAPVLLTAVQGLSPPVGSGLFTFIQSIDFLGKLAGVFGFAPSLASGCCSLFIVINLLFCCQAGIALLDDKIVNQIKRPAEPVAQGVVPTTAVTTTTQGLDKPRLPLVTTTTTPTTTEEYDDSPVVSDSSPGTDSPTSKSG